MASVDLSSFTGSYLEHEFEDDIDFEKSEATFVRQAIYGRDKETLILLNTYTRLLQTKQAQTVLLHGESGSGKTALVNVLRDRVCDGRTPAYFVTGKYFQNSGGVQEAHSAIMAAFSDLCDLVDQSDDTDEKRRSQIKEALGSDAQLLVKSISNLSPFVRDDIIDARIVPETFAGKFKLACKAFLHAMSCEEHPVVIFLDDIQWADEGSQQLIEMFLQDDSLRNVMLILAYRDEEAVQVERILEHARDSIDIQLSSIGLEAVHQIVSCFIGDYSSEDVKDLSELVAKRTLGNPYHVMMFMEMIQREGLLVFDSGCHSCRFDVDKIQMEMMASESLADLLTRKINLLLDSDITETLKVASLVGYRFDKAILLEVATATIEEEKQSVSERTVTSESTCQSVIASLANAVKEGFIEMTVDGYQFIHDKIQTSFRSMIDGAEEEDRLHLLIGKTFLVNVDGVNAQVYNAAVHLNRAPGFLNGPKQQSILANINLDAAKYCEEKSSFLQAVNLLTKGLAVIGTQSTRWSGDNFDLTFEMMESLARTQLVIGDFEGCKATVREALDHGRTVEIKINLLLIDVEVRMAGIEVVDSLSSAFRALEVLGVHLPRKAKQRHLVGKLLKVRRMLSHTTDSDILNLPILEDRKLNSTVKLLMFVCCYSITKNDSNAGIHAALLATELTLRNGLSPYSSSAFVLYGVAESLGNVGRAYRYGTLALAILELVPCKEAECFTVGFAMTMIMNHKRSFHQLIDPLCRIADSGYQRGDVLFASYSSVQYLQMHVILGTHLASVETSMRERCRMVHGLGQDGMLLWFQPALQNVMNLQSDMNAWENISVLTGEIMNEDDFFQKVEQAQHVILTTATLLVKAQTASYFEQHSLAASIYKKLKVFEQNIQIIYVAPFYYWSAARTHFCLYEQSGKLKHLQKGRRFRRLLERLKSSGCPTAVPLVAFMEAERQAQQKNVSETTLDSIFQQGIICMADHGFVFLKGLLNERAGFHFARRGLSISAERYFKRALHIYKYEWGATAKHNWLIEKSRLALMRTDKVSVAATPHGTSIEVDPIQQVPIL